MPERSTIYDHTQVGVERLPGSAAVANSRLLCTHIAPTGVVPMGRRPVSGGKLSSVTQRGHEYTYAELTGVLNYADIAYILSSLLCFETISTPPGASLTSRWTWRPAMYSPDQFRTMTVESGSPESGAERVSYSVVTDLTVHVSRSQCTLQGKILGQTLGELVTPYAAPNFISCLPVSPTECSVYVGDDVSTLSKITRCTDFSLSVGGRYGGVDALDGLAPFAAATEKAPKITAAMRVEHDSAGASMMSDLRAKKTKFFRLLCTGDLIEPAFPYRLQITFPFRYASAKPNNMDDEGLEYGLVAQGDTSFGTGIEVVLDTTLSSLNIPLPPLLPAPVLSGTAGNTQGTLTWTAVAGEVSTILSRSLSTGGPYSRIADSAGSSYTDTGLVNNTAYYYVAQAYDGIQAGVLSNEVALIPTAPTNTFPGILGWWRPDNWASTSPGSPAGNWLDHAGSLGTAIPVNSPLVELDSFSSIKYVQFDGVSQRFDGPFFTIDASNEYTIFIVAKWPGTGTGSLFDNRYAPGTDYINLFTQEVSATAGGAPLIAPQGSNPNGGSWQIIKLRVETDGTGRLQVNNGTVVSGSAGQFGNLNSFRLACQGSGASYGNVGIAELIIGSFTAATESLVWNYLDSEYNAY